MSDVTVYVPTIEDAQVGAVALAERRRPTEPVTITLVENGKPRARDLLEYIADRLRESIPVASVDIFSKASAGKPLSGDEAKVIAARARLVITGVGD